jgi:RNA polymerase sigma-70 factor (ECF subfamily)
MGDQDLALLASPEPAASELADASQQRALVLVRDHFDFVWRLLCRLGVPRPDADDAAQQVFIVATQRLGQIPHGGERTFLYGTALRTAATLRRNQRRRARWVEPGSVDCASPELQPDAELERRQALAFLDDVLQRLPDELREVFVLCEIEELTAPQVAGIAGIPAGTVASRLRRARQEFGQQARRLQAERARSR